MSEVNVTSRKRIGVIPWTSTGPGWSNSGWKILTEVTHLNEDGEFVNTLEKEAVYDIDLPEARDMRIIASIAMNVVESALAEREREKKEET